MHLGNDEFVVEQRAGAMTAPPRLWFFVVFGVIVSIWNFVVNGGPIRVEEAKKYVQEEKGVEKLR